MLHRCAGRPNGGRSIARPGIAKESVGAQSEAPTSLVRVDLVAIADAKPPQLRVGVTLGFDAHAFDSIVVERRARGSAARREWASGKLVDSAGDAGAERASQADLARPRQGRHQRQLSQCDPTVTYSRNQAFD